MLGVLVIIWKKVGKVSDAGTWALESLMSSLTVDKDDAGPDCGGVDLSVKFFLQVRIDLEVEGSWEFLFIQINGTDPGRSVP